MGVLIISPNDKGGMLYKPSKKLSRLCKPLAPMVWHDCWCLLRDEVHTLSVGASKASDYDAHAAAVDLIESGEAGLRVNEIASRLEGECRKVLGGEWWETWNSGLPEWYESPGNINIREVLRLYNLVASLDMKDFCRNRYNLFENGGHWFPGTKAENVEDLDFTGALARSPNAEKIPGLLTEAHRMLQSDEVKRLQEG